MIVRDLLTVIPSDQAVEICKLGSQRTDRISRFTEYLFEKTKYIDCEIALMRTYIENDRVILRLLVS